MGRRATFSGWSASSFKRVTFKLGLHGLEEPVGEGAGHLGQGTVGPRPSLRCSGKDPEDQLWLECNV